MSKVDFRNGDLTASELVETISTSVEQSLLIEREKASLQRDLEHLKATLASRLEDRKADAAMAQAMLSAGIAYANAALRALLLINGGGVLAILTFVGNLSARTTTNSGLLADRIATSVWWFTVGLTVAVVATGVSYVSQTIFHEARQKRWGWWIGGILRVVAMACALASLLSFAKGANLAAAALKLPLP